MSSLSEECKSINQALTMSARQCRTAEFESRDMLQNPFMHPRSRLPDDGCRDWVAIGLATGIGLALMVCVGFLSVI